MPLLTINSTKQVGSEEKESFFREVATLYADSMESETSFLSINFREISRENLWLGRATNSDSDLVVLEADVREGRPVDQRRTFALELMEKLHEEWSVPFSNMKVVFTEHRGTHMMGYDRVGSEWNDRSGK